MGSCMKAEMFVCCVSYLSPQSTPGALYILSKWMSNSYLLDSHCAEHLGFVLKLWSIHHVLLKLNSLILYTLQMRHLSLKSWTILLNCRHRFPSPETPCSKQLSSAVYRGPAQISGPAPFLEIHSILALLRQFLLGCCNIGISQFLERINRHSLGERRRFSASDDFSFTELNKEGGWGKAWDQNLF